MPQEKSHIQTVPEKHLWRNLFLTFFKIGAFTVGGGYAMIPLIEEAIVKKRRWMDSAQFMDMIAVSQSAPGVIAINSAVSVGYRVSGIPGALVATCGAALPSFLIIMVIAMFFLNFQHEYLASFFTGVRPAVTVLLVLAAINMGKKAVNDKAGLILIGGGLIGIILLGVHPIWAIFAAALFGVIYYRYRP